MSDQVKKIEDQTSEGEVVPFAPKESGQQKKEKSSTEFEKNKIDENLNKPEQEKQTIETSRELIKKTAPGSAEKVLSAAKPEVMQHVESSAKVEDAQEQVDRLIDLAKHENPFLAIKVAKHLDNNYVLDSVHDELLEEKTRKILIEKGLLKEV